MLKLRSLTRKVLSKHRNHTNQIRFVSTNTRTKLDQNEPSLSEKLSSASQTHFTQFTEKPKINHNPILANEVINCFNDKTNLVIDATFGSGGHTKKLLETYPNIKVIGLDIDLETSGKFAQDLVNKYPKRFFFMNTNFKNLYDDYQDYMTRQISRNFNLDPETTFPDGIIYDLGPCSYQIEDEMRGFSNMENGPLDMRYNRKTQKLSASQIINFADKEELAMIFKNYGDEPNDLKIADAIIDSRYLQPIVSTYELSGLISRCLGELKTGFDPVQKIRNHHKQHLHISNKVFTALRIHINDELNNLYKSLCQAEHLLAVGGKICIISKLAKEDAIFKFATGKYQLGNPQDQFEFEYSLEELRKSQNLHKVWNKNKEIMLEGALYYRDKTPWESKTVKGSQGNHKFILPTQKEVLENGLARSAKLRCVEKVREVGKFEPDFWDWSQRAK